MESRQKKKILYLITKSNWGGAQRYVYDLATHLDKNEYEPVVAMGGNGQLSEMLNNAGVPTHSLQKLKNTTALSELWGAGRELYTLLRTEKPDVLHLNSSVAGLIGAIVGRLARVPRIVFTAHGWAFNEDRPWWQRFIFKWLHYLTVLLSHHTIAVSTAMVTQLNWPFAQRHMSVINPGRTIGPMFPRDEAREKICDFFPQLRPHASDTWLVCIAELHPIKQHHVLFEAISNLIHEHPDLRLICIGDGQMKGELIAKVHTLGLAEYIFVVGSVLEAARFLKAFDILVLASRSESYGYVLHEAGLAEVPVVATNVGGITDIITHNYNGLLVQSGSIASLAQALSTYLGNKELRTKHAAQLKTDLLPRSIFSMSAKTTGIY